MAIIYRVILSLLLIVPTLSFANTIKEDIKKDLQIKLLQITNQFLKEALKNSASSISSADVNITINSGDSTTVVIDKVTVIASLNLNDRFECIINCIR